MAPDPPTAPPVESFDALDYLRRHGRTYTRHALDERLREAGHQPKAIADAWDALEAERQSAAAPGSLATFIAIVGGLLAILVFGGSAALGFLGAGFSPGQPDANVGLIFATYAIAAIVAGIGVLFLIRRGRRADHAVLGVLGAIGVGALVWLGISGLCLATSGGFTV